MYGYDNINYDEIDENIDFASFVIEFFKNQYLVIVDFLSGTSPWDNSIMFMLNKTREELNKDKLKLLGNIIDTYRLGVLNPIFEQDSIIKRVCTVDVPFLTEFNMKPDFIYVFFSNNYSAIQILRYYVCAIRHRYELKLDTYNQYQTDILEILTIYEELSKEIGIDAKGFSDVSEKEYESKYLKFFPVLYERVKQYIIDNFRTGDERKYFIYYLYSLAYAYLRRTSEFDDLSEEEEEIITLIDEGTEDLVLNFLNDSSIVTSVVELLHQNYEDNKLGYDFRKEINDDDSQRIFRNLDENYDTKYEKVVALDYCDLDLKLNKVLGLLIEQFSVPELYNIMLDNITIYSQLYEVGLDARNSERYKKMMIKKIVSDVFEYESYNKLLDSDYEVIHYDKIKNLKSDFDDVLQYFGNNGFSLLELYVDYHVKGLRYREKARIQVCGTDDLKVINALNDFSMFNYINIINGSLKPLKSVDFINEYAKKLKDIVESKTGIMGLQISVDVIRLMCLNVYENILTDEVSMQNENLRNLVSIIENNDIVEYSIQNPIFLSKICNMFVFYNKEELSYSSEIIMRKKFSASDKVKVLKKLNPFEEEI